MTRAQLRLGMVATYPPTRCGIGRFTRSLTAALLRRGHAVDVLRLRPSEDQTGPASDSPEVVMEFDPNSPVSVRRAAQRLSRYDVAVVQHEFGIFGADDGLSVLDLLRETTAPVLVVLHTVLQHPSPRHRRIVEAMAGMAAGLVVPSAAAKRILVQHYDIGLTAVQVIPHGSPWVPAPPAPAPRRKLLTWGLLGPGKGIERAIEAVSLLRDVDPAIRYRVIGQIHPNVLRREGTAYREHLEGLIRRLGVEDMVQLDHRYQGELALWEAAQEAHAIVLPYDNDQQICSGVLTEAVSAGRPVVATSFPHAVELLGSGAGFLVTHSPQHMAAALRTLLTDDVAYERAAEEARGVGFGLSWDQVARSYEGILASLTSRTPAVA